jgi:hypothetical protein
MDRLPVAVEYQRRSLKGSGSHDCILFLNK